MKKRIVIADDHVSIRDMLVWILRNQPEYEIAGEAGTGLEAVKACIALRPDLLILDLILPCLSGVEVLRRVRKELPQTRILIYSGTSNDLLIRQVLIAGAHGFIEKTEALKTLREAIATVARGGSYHSCGPASLLRQGPGVHSTLGQLSPREREILQMVGEGNSTKEIASRLLIAVKTVENHRANLRSKLGAHSVADLTRIGVREGFVNLG